MGAQEDEVGLFAQHDVAQELECGLFDRVDGDPGDLFVQVSGALSLVDDGIGSPLHGGGDIFAACGEKEIALFHFGGKDRGALDRLDLGLVLLPPAGDVDQIGYFHRHPIGVPAFLGASGRISASPSSSLAARSIPSESIPMSLAGLRLATTQT